MLAERDAHTDLLIRPGQCPTHGLVQATKPVPTVRFPFLVFGVLRLWAMQRPYRCPAVSDHDRGLSRTPDDDGALSSIAWTARQRLRPRQPSTG